MPTEPAGPRGPYASLYSSCRAGYRSPSPGPRVRSERRGSDRIPTRTLYAVCRETHPFVEELRVGSIADLSADGLAVVLSRPFASGTLLGVELQDAGGWIKGRIRARVVYSRSLSSERWAVGCVVLGDLDADRSEEESVE